MFKNTSDLKPLANFYDANGYYPFQDEWNSLIEELNKGNKRKTKIMPTFDMMSYDAQMFANKWRDIFINGYEHDNGGNPVPVTGEHMFYLNVVQIELIKKLKRDEGVDKSLNVSGRDLGKRAVFFPDFWDEDFRYFWTCRIARMGIGPNKLARLQKNGMALGLVETKENLEGGLNHLYLKPRGVGASWKAGAWNAYNMYLLPDTQNFIFADNNQFLGDKDGIFSKFVKIRDFIQANCWFLYVNFNKESPSERIYTTGLRDAETGSNITAGLNTSVAGIVIENKPAKARGKRGNGTFEEFGSFPGVAKTWNVFDSSIRAGSTVFAQARGFGTGGDEGANYEDLETMFRDPKTYRIIQFINIYEQNADKPIAMFTPAWINITDIDADGNSLIELGREKWLREQVIKKEGTDPTALSQFLAEKPGKPADAFNAIGINIFPVDLLQAQLDRLKRTDEDRKLCIYGDLVYKVGGGVKMVPNDKKPYESYPVKHGTSKESVPVIFEKPYLVNGKIPKDLYRIAVDPYAHAESANSESLMDIRVIENSNNFTPLKGDVIVAWYRGRPEGFDGQTKACEILFKFAEMYGCERAVAIENDQPGEVISHAKLYRDSQGRKLTRYLAEQFQLDIDTDSGKNIRTTPGMRRIYGMNVNKNRKEEGLKYLQQWFLRPRIEKINQFTGQKESIRNIDLIFDRALLAEAIGYNGGNADAISAMIVAIYHEKELLYDNRYANKEKKVDVFFTEHSLF